MLVASCSRCRRLPPSALPSQQYTHVSVTPGLRVCHRSARLVDLAQTDDRFARMLADPYPKRETIHPVTDDIEVCVVGTGYGGLW